jgi:rubredoxin/uncharacterized membrane protein
MKKWQCTVCKYIHEDDAPPEKCPICGVPASRFVLLEETGEPEAAPRVEKKEPLLVSEPAPEGPESKPGPDSFYEKLTRFLVRHHTHPVMVHMPNGILPAVAVLFILGCLFDYSLFVKAGFINLVFVILALPLVLFSGILEWQIKYQAALTTIFKVKILAATLTTTSCMISVIWYLIDPDVLNSSKGWVFLLLNLGMLASAGVAGHIGGKLVFKD